MHARLRASRRTRRPSSMSTPSCPRVISNRRRRASTAHRCIWSVIRTVPEPWSIPTAGGPYDGPDDDVKRWILQHSEVIEDGWQRAGTVLPVSFNVIVRPDPDSGASATAQLEGWLEGSRASLTQRLQDLDGTSELRVEISLDRGTFVEDNDEIRTIRTDMADRPAGVRRLLEKRLEKTEKELVDRAADDLYPAVRARIAQQCLDIEEYRSPTREAEQTPVLMASCLVTELGIQGLGAELTAIQNEQAAIAIRFLGPWPPYSFADMSGSETQLQARQESR